MAEIELKNLPKRWGNFVGVDNFNLTIPDEEFLVLLGPVSSLYKCDYSGHVAWSHYCWTFFISSGL